MLAFARLDQIPGQSRVLLRLGGPDAQRFLQGIASADVAARAGGRAVVAALLTVKGKLVSELVVVDGPDGALDLLVPIAVADSVADILERYIVMDDVVLTRPEGDAVAVLWRRGGAPGAPGPVVPGAPGLRQFATVHPLPGTLILGPIDQVAAALGEAEPVDLAGFDRARVASRTPGWGSEILPGFFPAEVGFNHGVAHDKGCYLGQEPIARIHARGQVQRVMVEVAADHPVATPVVLATTDRPDAGTWTTCVAEGSAVAGLAIVRRDYARPGTLLHAEGEPRIAVRVMSDPLGDDPGISVG